MCSSPYEADGSPTNPWCKCHLPPERQKELEKLEEKQIEENKKNEAIEEYKDKMGDYESNIDYILQNISGDIDLIEEDGRLPTEDREAILTKCYAVLTKLDEALKEAQSIIYI